MTDPIRRRCGFTLIEILIAIALGAIVLLIAIIGTRIGAQTLRDISRQMAVNEALRTGWIALADEADTWRSYADRGFPHGRDFMHVGQTAAGGTTIDQKRLFRQRIPPPPAGNDGMLDPSSPAAFMLNGQLPAVVGFPVARVPDSGDRRNINRLFQANYPAGFGSNEWRLMYGVIEGPCALTSFKLTCDDLVDATTLDPDTRSKWSTWVGGGDLARRAAHPFSLPRGWDPWHIMGDWPSLANIGGVLAGVIPAGTPNLQSIQYAAFRNNGHLGVWTYAPPGIGNIIATAPENRENVTANQGVGEVPGSLLGLPRDPLGTAGAENDYSTGMPGPSRKAKVVPVVTEVRLHISNPGGRVDQQSSLNSEKNRRLLALFPPNNFNGLVDRLFVDIFQNTTLTSNLWSGNLRWMLIDYDSAGGWSVGYDGIPASPHGMIYANRVIFDQTSGAWDYNQMTDDWYRDPLRLLWGDNSAERSTRELTRFAGRSIRPMIERHVVWTDHVPAAPADAVLTPIGIDTAMMRLRTGIVRWRSGGADRALGQVMVSADGSAETWNFAMPLIGSTFRGARMRLDKD